MTTATTAVALQTQRLRLRGPHRQDADDLLAIYSSADVARYLSRPAWTGIDQAYAWLDRMHTEHEQGNGLQLMLERREGARVIGTCALFRLDFDNRRAEIGYTLARDCWGHGYMHEALVALLDHGFDALRLHRVEADVDPRNAASARVLERPGFRHEGRLRQRWQAEGEVSDSDIYGLLAPEWRT